MLTYLENTPRSRGSNAQHTKVLEQTIFYATNRQRGNTAEPYSFYSGARNTLKQLKYGQCRVTLPISHTKGQIESPLINLKFFQNPKAHVV